MSLIAYNDWAPAEGHLTTYDVKESDIFASEVVTEDGHDYIERARVSVHEINVGYTNITGEDLEALLAILELANFAVSFIFGKQINGTFRTIGDKNIKLKYTDAGVSYWDAAFTIKEI